MGSMGGDMGGKMGAVMDKMKGEGNKMGARGMSFMKQMKECMCNSCQDEDACSLGKPDGTEEPEPTGPDCDANALVQMLAEKKGAKKVKKAVKKIAKAWTKYQKGMDKADKAPEGKKRDKALKKFSEDEVQEYRDYLTCTEEEN